MYRVSQRIGEPRVEQAPLGVRLTTKAGEELTIDLPNGARLRLEADSAALLSASEPATLLFVSGALYVQMPPQGSAAGRPVLRVATADYAISVPVAGEVWLARPAASSGKRSRPAYLALLTGRADLERLPAVAGDPIETLAIGPGFALAGSAPRASAKLATAGGPRTIEDARKAYGRAAAASPASRDPDPEPILEAALSAWDDAERRGREILAAQREAKLKADANGVQSGQHDLVAHAQAKLAIRQKVRLAFELASARALGRWGDADSELAGFEARYATRVAPALPTGP